jgi:hypothetical protein
MADIQMKDQESAQTRSDGGSPSSDSDEFLLDMYNQLWQSIQRVEQGMWSFITAQAGAIAALVGGITELIPLYYSSIFTIFISIWGMNISIASDRWFYRNLAQVTNIEKRFFRQDGDEWGDILPEIYKNAAGKVIQPIPLSHNSANFFAFMFLFVISVIIPFSSLGSDIPRWINSVILVIATIGAVVTAVNYRQSARSVVNFIEYTSLGHDSGDDATADPYYNREPIYRGIILLAGPAVMIWFLVHLVSVYQTEITDLLDALPWFLLPTFVTLASCSWILLIKYRN